MTKVAMLLGHDLLEPNEDNRVYREALTLVKENYEVTVFCWARRMEKYETKWEVERDGINVVRIFEELEGIDIMSPGAVALASLNKAISAG
mgnify:CR=1 FL=1